MVEFIQAFVRQAKYGFQMVSEPQFYQASTVAVQHHPFSLLIWVKTSYHKEYKECNVLLKTRSPGAFKKNNWAMKLGCRRDNAIFYLKHTRIIYIYVCDLCVCHI